MTFSGETEKGNRLNRIGLFDSGAGGLSVLRRLVFSTRDTSFVYLADTARCPYGDRSTDEISLFAEQTARWLFDSAVDRIVMACNTSASIAGSMLRNRLTVPVHDLIRPAAVHCARFKSVAVFATAATCRSAAFSRAIADIDPDVRVLEIPCPELVPLVETGHLSDDLAVEAVGRCIGKLNNQPVDAVVLGCTHFPFLSEVFQALLPSSTAVVDPAEHLQLELSPLLRPGAGDRYDLLGPFQRCSFFTTGDADTFARLAERCLGLGPGQLSKRVCGISTDDFQGITPLIVEGLNVVNTLTPLSNPGTAL